MKDFIIGVLWMFVVVCICEIHVDQKALEKENSALRAQLDDPHHCLSVCVEEFKKMGC